MAVSIADIKKLRELTQAGMGDCKKALEESNGDFDAAVKWIREKFTKIAAKREARDAAQGIVIARTEGNYAAIMALKCETESVANNDRFQDLAKAIMDLIMANKPVDQAALLALPLEGSTVQAVITERSGACGEKMEVVYEFVKGEGVVAYNHFNHMLSAIVAFNQNAAEEALKAVACQVVAMNPVAVNADEIPQEKKDEELNIAIIKTKEEQIQKAVEAALKKAGLNPNHFDSEDHIESNMSKGWITAEQAEQGRKIMKEAAEQKAANLPEAMIQNIAKGRLNKFFKENCLVEQEFINDSKMNVQQYMDSVQKGLTVTAFKRINLNQD